MQNRTNTTSPPTIVKPVLCVSASLNKATMSREELINIGFYELPHLTIMNSLIYDLGRNRQLSIGCLGNPNEMVFICQIDMSDKRKITDVVVLRNFDYDGFITIDGVKNIIQSITGRIF